MQITQSKKRRDVQVEKPVTFLVTAMSQHVFNLLDNIWKRSEGDREQCSSDVSLFYFLVCVCVTSWHRHFCF